MSGGTQELLTGADVSVSRIACPGDGTSSPQELIGSSRYELCLVRAGSFLLRGSVVEGRAVEVFCDPTVCLFGAPEHVVEVTHPRPGGDLDTCVFLSAEVLDSMGGVSGLPACAPRTREISWLHRRLLALCSQDDTDSLAIEEAALSLFMAALAQAEPGRWSAGRTGARDRRRLADEARAALVADPTISRVVDLAQMLGCSPHHLSRLFREQTGHTLAEFRTALRIELALERLMQGDDNLARVAADLGFADHAHLTRTMRRKHGQTPSAMRALISSHRGPSAARGSELGATSSMRAILPPRRD